MNPANPSDNKGAGKKVVSDRNPCPHAPDCRRNWIYIAGTETADCAYCYQNLDRSTMVRIFAGTA